MGRRKVSMGLIPTRRVRVSTFGKRKEGLKKKANELSVLCGVEVALVVAPADGDGGAGAGEADVWESKDGVLARYRELDPAVRARHTFRDYLYAELGKEEAKLARVRQAGPDGLDCWDKALDDVDTVDEARKLLDAIDSAIQAADDRRRALGMPVDDEDEDGGGAGIVLEGIAPLHSAHVDDGYLLRALAGGDANDQATAMALWGSNGFLHPCSAASMQYGFQQFNSGNVVAMEGGYDLQMVPDMYNNNGGLATDAYHYQTRSAGAMLQHGCYGFPCARAGAGASYYGMPSGYQMQQVVGSAAAQPNLAMSSADKPFHAMVPVPVPADTGLNYMDTLATHGVHDGSGGASFGMDARGNFINAAPAFPVAMSNGGAVRGNFISAPGSSGTSDNFTPAHPLAMSHGGDMTAAGGSYATQSGMEELHYLGDMEDTQPPNPFGN